MATATSNQLTKKQFDARWQQIDEQFDAHVRDAKSMRDQARAKLLAESGWTQQAIAEQIGKHSTWVDKYMRFGRFLDYAHTSGMQADAIPPNLTERLFRRAWSECRGPSDEARFAAVIVYLQENLTVEARIKKANNEQIASRIASRCADAKWRSAAQIAKKIDYESEAVLPFLKRMKSKGTHGTFVQEREFKDETQYKIRKGSGKKVQLDVLMSEIEPLLKELEMQGRKEHMSEYCPAVILNVVGRLRKLLNERSS